MRWHVTVSLAAACRAGMVVKRTPLHFYSHEEASPQRLFTVACKRLREFRSKMWASRGCGRGCKLPRKRKTRRLQEIREDGLGGTALFLCVTLLRSRRSQRARSGLPLCLMRRTILRIPFFVALLHRIGNIQIDFRRKESRTASHQSCLGQGVPLHVDRCFINANELLSFENGIHPTPRRIANQTRELYLRAHLTTLVLYPTRADLSVGNPEGRNRPL